MLNYLDTVISEYSNSPAILSLLYGFNQAIDPTPTIDLFWEACLNLDTATGYGLDRWGRILGIGRVLKLPDGVNLGFSGDPSDASGDSFNTSPFYAGTALTGNVALSDDGFRTLLVAKALANISDGSVKSINAILQVLFMSGANASAGNCYVVDNQNMTMAYKFNRPLTAIELTIVQQSGVLPRPVGVLAQIQQATGAVANVVSGIN